MRFHHSTRRGRHHSAPSHHQISSSTRWSQLNHCRETNIYFNRRLPAEYPATSASFDGPFHGGGQTMGGGSAQEQQLIQQPPSAAMKLEEEPLDLDLNSVREKLVAQVQKHPFWSNKAAKRMQIKSFKRRNVYIYELESYCERRDLEWNFEPYRGGLSAGSVTPYRSYGAVLSSGGGGGSSLSQPATPINQPASSNQFVWTTELSNNHPDAKSLVSRSQSNKIPPTPTPSNLAASSPLNKSSQLLSYEPVSARLEHLIPSPDYIWSIDVTSRQQLQRGRRHPASPGCVTSELPNSSFVKRCHGCQGRGKLKCNLCHGVGYEVCLSCSGKGTTRSYSASSGGRASGYSRAYDRSSSGYHDPGDPDQSYRGGGGSGAADGNSRNSRYANGDQSSGFGNSLGFRSQESCGTCHGAGQKRCWVCAGKSYNNCPGCLGTGSLRCFLTLIVSWLSHCDDVIINNSDQIIPKERLRISSGLVLVDQVEDRLRPLNLIFVPAANNTNAPGQSGRQQQVSSCCRTEAEQLQLASKHLLEKHQQTYKGEKFLKQRHKVTQIECCVVKYEWKQRHGQFVIYGEDRKVYIGKYPFKSFCNLI